MLKIINYDKNCVTFSFKECIILAVSFPSSAHKHQKTASDTHTISQFIS